MLVFPGWGDRPTHGVVVLTKPIVIEDDAE